MRKLFFLLLLSGIIASGCCLQYERRNSGYYGRADFFKQSQPQPEPFNLSGKRAGPSRGMRAVVDRSRIDKSAGTDHFVHERGFTISEVVVAAAVMALMAAAGFGMSLSAHPAAMQDGRYTVRCCDGGCAIAGRSRR